MKSGSVIENDNFRKKIIAVMWACILMLFAAAGASAHRVNVFAWVEGDMIHVETSFSGGKPVKGGKIIVTDADGNALLTGETNPQGEFSFAVPQRTELKIILDAGSGHRAAWTIPLTEIQAATPAETSSQKQHPGAQTSTAQPAETSLPASASPPCAATTTVAEIELAVEKVLDRKLKPILKMVAAAEQKNPTVRDIVAGIGYIMGLVGIAAYMHSRTKSNPDKG